MNFVISFCDPATEERKYVSEKMPTNSWTVNYLHSTKFPGKAKQFTNDQNNAENLEYILFQLKRRGVPLNTIQLDLVDGSEVYPEQRIPYYIMFVGWE